ncbi:sigma-70 family RNA polymerase sigma factor [Actinomadura fulvescens]|uniref:Sigma-70 family RNA polymerase sigma factor n=1 Tax=Actinomadura fulvescens TaxID=46160 RepID=A0ABP6CKN3_9ACTN
MGEAASDLTLANSSDAVLLARIRDGHVAAYGTLYERHLGAARRLARDLIDGDRAEDAVQDTFVKILDVVRRGGGPHSAFRPYLLTAVRRTVYDRHRSEKRLQPTDQIELYDPGMPFTDPAVEGLERSMIVGAYQSLPERWQAVLWHTEIEGAKPADIAPLLGLTANGVAALAYRAREGLRQAYLQMHLADLTRTGLSTGLAALDTEASTQAGAVGGLPGGVEVATERCRPVLEKLGSFVRGGLARRDARTVERHLDECDRCKAIYLELADVNTALREALGPFVLGAAATAYLAAAAKGGIAAGGVFGWFRQLPRGQQQALAGGMATVVVAVAAGLVLASDERPDRPMRTPSPAAQPPAAEPPRPRASAPAPERPPPPLTSRSPTLRPPSPAPQPPPPVRHAELTTRIGTIGALLREQPGIVAMSVSNTGDAASRDVIADVDLPPGVTYAGGATGRNSVAFKPRQEPGDGWSCRPLSSPVTRTKDSAAGAGVEPDTGMDASTGNEHDEDTLVAPADKADKADKSVEVAPQDDDRSRVRCTHAPVPAGAATSAYLHVDVGENAPFNAPPQVTLRAGDVRAGARAADGVRVSGMPARFAADGKLRIVQAGNALLSCDASEEPGCAKALRRQGERRDNDLWDMAPLDLDRVGATESSSAAQVEVPGGARVLWAGLYWSGVGGAGPAKLRPPGGTYERVRPAQVDRRQMPDFGVYQAFADVTELVRRHGGGQWWGADVPTETGTSHYAGWALVVVMDDPKAPYRQAMVLDGARSLGPHAAHRVNVPVNGLLATAEPARIGVVAWEGDAGLTGDRLLLGGRPLTPAAGDRSADNVADGSANGAIGAELTFGIDVDYFSTRLDGRGTLRLTTRQDAYLAGVITVTAPMRS